MNSKETRKALKEATAATTTVTPETMVTPETTVTPEYPALRYTWAPTRQPGGLRMDGGGSRSHAAWTLRSPFATLPVAGDTMTLRVVAVEVPGHTLHLHHVNTAGEPVYTCGNRTLTLVRALPQGCKVDGVYAPMLACDRPLSPAQTPKPTADTKADGATDVATDTK